MRGYGTAILLCVAALGCEPVETPAESTAWREKFHEEISRVEPAPVAAPEVDAFVRAAIASRLGARGVLSIEGLSPDDPLIVHSYMPKARALLTRGALPEQSYALMSGRELQEYADRVGRSVSFIAVDLPAVAGGQGTVWLGIDVVSPRPFLVAQCCCAGKARFVRRPSEEWAFVEWAEILCS